MTSTSIRPSFSSFSCVGGVASSRFGVSVSSLQLPRRLLFSHLGSVVLQSRYFGFKGHKMLRAEETKSGMPLVENVVRASTATFQETASLEWVRKDKRRMLHVVYRVRDLDRTIKFYTECLGMKLLRKRDIPEERYTNEVCH